MFLFLFFFRLLRQAQKYISEASKNRGGHLIYDQLHKYCLVELRQASILKRVSGSVLTTNERSSLVYRVSFFMQKLYFNAVGWQRFGMRKTSLYTLRLRMVSPPQNEEQGAKCSYVTSNILFGTRDPSFGDNLKCLKK